MLLNFYVRGRPPGSEPIEESTSKVDKAIEWTKTTALELSEMNFDEVVDSVKDRANRTYDACKRIFKFLSGNPVPSPQHPQLPTLEVQEEKKERGWMSGVTGLFSGLKGPSGSSVEVLPDPSLGPIAAEGEVHADLVMVSHVDVTTFEETNILSCRIPKGISSSDTFLSTCLVCLVELRIIKRITIDTNVDSNARNPKRVFVVRSDGVRESERVMRWHK